MFVLVQYSTYSQSHCRCPEILLFIAHPENAKIKFFLPGPEALLEARTLSSTIDKPYVLFGTPFICWSEVGKDCARESPPKTRYSGHSYSRLMRNMTKHVQSKGFSYTVGKRTIDWKVDKGMQNTCAQKLAFLVFVLWGHSLIPWFYDLTTQQGGH